VLPPILKYFNEYSKKEVGIMRKRRQIIDAIITFMSLLAALNLNNFELIALVVFMIIISKSGSDFNWG
jgi:hypothetical protein